MATLNEFDLIQTAPLPRGNSSFELLLRTGVGVTRQVLNYQALARLGADLPTAADQRNPFEQATFNAQYFSGRSVLDTITLTAPAYETEVQDRRTGAYQKVTIASESITLSTVVVDVSQTHNIIRTQILGRNGTVKEYIGLDDYELTLRGAVVNTADRTYPTDEMKKLASILQCPEHLAIVSRYLQDIFNLTSVVITGKTFPMSEGVENTQLFELRALSDAPLELTSVK